jgi:tetratricopeptide (TPR) repeat protein
VSPEVSFEYADALILAGRLDRALEVAEGLSVPAHRHLVRGRVAQKRREPARALEEYEAALRLWPDNAVARYYTALAAQELGDFERAIEEFRNAVRVDPSATDARTLAAAQLFAAEGLEAAQTMLLTEIDEAPLDVEGLLLGMRVSGLQGNTTGVADYLKRVEKRHPAWVGKALAEAADGLAKSNSPEMAISMLTTAPGADFNQPRYAAALRSLVKYSHQVADASALRTRIQRVLALHADSGEYQEIRAYDLELSGAPAEAVQAAYSRALELDPENALALSGLGRLAAGKDPEAALVYFDRAAAADPSNPEPKLEAARILVAGGKLAEAQERFEALLLEHPCVAEAASESARIDLERGVATARTVERARRAARFGGGADALDLLSRVHTQRKESDLAARAADGARVLRQAQAPEG